MRSLDDIFEEYDFLDDRDDRHRLIIELGRALEPMPAALKTENTKVRGCIAQVWVYPLSVESDRLHFLADSDSELTKGIIALILSAIQDKPAAEVASIDIPGTLERFELSKHFTSRRTQGVPNMIALVQDTARRIAAG